MNPIALTIVSNINKKEKKVFIDVKKGELVLEIKNENRKAKTEIKSLVSIKTTNENSKKIAS